MADTLARKATVHEARRAFERGARVVVTETPRGDTLTVHPGMTTNHVGTQSWQSLHDAVKAWRGRYPRQTFYVVAES